MASPPKSPVELDESIRIISMRKADSDETDSITKTPLTSDDDAPKLTQADFDGAKLRVAGRDVNRAESQLAAHARVGKQRINIMQVSGIG